MMAGMILVILALVRHPDEKVEIGTLFKGFDHFIQAFLLCLVWLLISIVPFTLLAIIPVLGSILLYFAAALVYMVAIFACFFIVDKGMDFWPASKMAIKAIQEHFPLLFGYFVVSYILASIGGILFGIGAFLTLPILYCMSAIAYEELCSGREAGSPPDTSSATSETEFPEGQTDSDPGPEAVDTSSSAP